MTVQAKWDGKEDVLDWALSLPKSEPPPSGDLVDLLTADATVDLRKAESALEERMFAALCACGFNTTKGSPQRLGDLLQQHEVRTSAGTFRLDYAVVRTVGRRRVRVAVELDGHEFHQKTKEQVERDHRRSRALAKAGWTVLRYAGSEVWRDAGACALDVAGVVIEAVDRIVGGDA